MAKLVLLLLGVVIVAMPACACNGRGGGGGGGGGNGGGSAADCVAVRAHVEDLYRRDATEREPKRVDEAVADNTAMVIAQCERAPARVSKCAAGAASADDLEARCLPPLDDEGSEGDRFR
jgi:hypothetical protein